MSKNHDTNAKDSKNKNDPKHKKYCKSKHVTCKKQEHPAEYYKKYEKGRNDEGCITKLRLKALVTLLFEIYSHAIPSEMHRLPHMACLADKVLYCHSYRRHVSYLQTHQGTLRLYGLKTVPSKSCLHHAAILTAGYE